MVVKAVRVAGHGTSATADCKYEYESDAVTNAASGSVILSIPDVEVTVEAVAVDEFKSDNSSLEMWGKGSSNNRCCP
jgi:hypothetical protein